MKKKYLIWIIFLINFGYSGLNNSVFAQALPSGHNFEEIAEGIIEWKKINIGSNKEDFLMNNAFLELAGSTPGDWFPIGLGRLNVRDNQSGYLATINDNIEKRYRTSQKLDAAKATEWHRISLAILACGGNPRRMGMNSNIDLIADGTYNRVDENGKGVIGKQGINGFIWGLIALDSRFYEVPIGAYYSRDDLILNILNRQLKEGGWALSGDESDPDITAMAIQSLVPYYNSEKIYAYINKNFSNEGKVISKKVRTSIDEALKWLSNVQKEDGGYFSWGMPNSESDVQVAVALSSLGIDLFTDDRFIKKNKTVFDGILKYRNTDGGFLHSFIYDADNPSSLPNTSNSMASEQALYGIVSIIRFQNNQRRLYDFREEMNETVIKQIKLVEQQIEKLTYETDIKILREVYNNYLTIEALERSYVKNYKKLSEILSFSGIEFVEEKIEYNSGDAGIVEALEEFNEVDFEKVNALPINLTTAFRIEVLKLYAKIKNCFNFEGKEQISIKLEKAKNEIESIQREIDSINREILDKLHPFDKIGLKDRAIIYNIVDRFNALSEYDRTKILHYEDLLKSKTQIDNLTTALIISITCGCITISLASFFIINLKKRKKNKLSRLMEESEE